MLLYNSKRRNYTLFYLAVILFLGVASRIYRLEAHSLWYDESTSVLERGGLNRLPALNKLFDKDFLIKNRDYLNLYSNSFIYYWQKLFNKTEFGLRLSSVIFSVLSIYLLYLLGKIVFDTRVARLSAFLLAISPLHIYYSQELRPYAAACFFTTLSLYSFFKILNGGGKKYYFLYIIANVLNIYFFCISVIFLLPIFIFLLSKIKQYMQVFKRIIIADALILFFALPVFLTLYPNLQFILSHKIDKAFSEFPIWGGEKVEFRHLIFTFKNFSIGYNVDYFSLIGRLATATYLTAFVWGVITLYKNSGKRLIILSLLIPILLLFLLSQIKTCYVDRYFFPVLPLYLLVSAAALTRLGTKTLLLTIAMLIGFGFSGLKNYYSDYLPKDKDQFIGVGQRYDVRGAAKVILRHYQSGDKIMHISKNTVFPLKFYIHRDGSSPDLISEVDKGTVIFMSGSKKENKMLVLNYPGERPRSFLPKEYQPASRQLAGNNRIWLLFSDFIFPQPDTQGYELVNRISRRFKLIKLDKFDGVFLYLFGNDFRRDEREPQQYPPD